LPSGFDLGWQHPVEAAAGKVGVKGRWREPAFAQRDVVVVQDDAHDAAEHISRVEGVVVAGGGHPYGLADRGFVVWVPPDPVRGHHEGDVALRAVSAEPAGVGYPSAVA